jgi:RecG-like helicase
MEKTTFLKSIVAGLLLLAIATPPMTMAAAGDKTETITGEGKCGKCALKETEKCQNVIQVEKDGKKITYYLVQNKVSKDFHGNLCKESQKVTATGTVKEVDGKKQFTVTKIELVKE